MATIIYVDGKSYKVNKSDNLLKACLSLGLDIPYFCWHPELGSIGACRQCAVKRYQNAHDVTGQIIMSCMTPVEDKVIISINDVEAQRFRQNIVELLMINHPHDCPICEEGGSCHLQDMTVMNKQYHRRYRFTKRTHLNQYLGPFISHEMNRCIACYRCVRYYKDYANGCDFGVYGAHDNIYFGRPQDGVLENEFAGNLVEICPTGVFADKTYSDQYSRKWDMQFSPSICHQCCVGCNIIPGERYGKIIRIENRYNSSVNGYFLCDLGRFGYGYVNSESRPKRPLQRQGYNWIPLTVDQAVYAATNILRFANRTIGVGSPRASIESNFALRELVGDQNFYTGISKNEQSQLELILTILRKSGIYTPSLREIESYDAILVLGEDLTQTAARIALAVRQAVQSKARKLALEKHIPSWHASAVLNIGQNDKYPLFITNVDQTRLDDVASWSYYAPVEDQSRLGFAIAHAIDQSAPEVMTFDSALSDKVDTVAQALVESNKPLIISGSSARFEALITASANVARALKIQEKDVGIVFVTGESNSMGIVTIGGANLDDALHRVECGNVDNMIVVENDLYRYSSAARINSALNKISNLIVIDHQKTEIQNRANLILSAASFAESSGTLINQEGRAQRFFQVYDPSYYNSEITMLESWQWLHLIRSSYLNSRAKWTSLDQTIDEIAIKLPQLAKIKQAAPDANFRVCGQKLARQPNRYSGRTSICASTNVHEKRIPQDENTMFTFSMEGDTTHATNQNIAFVSAPGWNSPQAWNKFQDEVGGRLKNGDPGIRIIETEKNFLDYFRNIPATFIRLSKKSWRIAPYWQLFGSEETSQRSPVIQTRMKSPYLVISMLDSSRMGIKNGTILSFTCIGLEFRLQVKLSKNLSPGQIGLPLGFPGIPPILAGQNVTNLRKIY